MALIKSVSGIRGTIGGKAGENLTADDILKYTAAFGLLIKEKSGKNKPVVIIGRDARISGKMVLKIVAGVLNSVGINVVNIGLASTPTVELAVTDLGADGGIIITASHNPRNWNALKLLNKKGEFLSASEGEAVLRKAENEFDKIIFADTDSIGTFTVSDFLENHIQKITRLEEVDTEAISAAGFKVAYDAINSVGAIFFKPLLEALGVNEIYPLNDEPTGEFAHNPEPLPKNLTEISDLVKREQCDIGFVTDPDGDRLALVTEKGEMFGEEYTIVAIADYLLAKKTGHTVSNLSSSRALKDISLKHKGTYSASAVGEVNVVEEMKRSDAIFGGEGNGGVIYPELHYGRDALVGVALFLSHLAKSGKTASELRASYPDYYIIKKKIQLNADTDIDAVLQKVKTGLQKRKAAKINTTDGVKADFPKGWVHLRKSNTEPIIRVYAESKSEFEAEALAESVIKLV